MFRFLHGVARVHTPCYHGCLSICGVDGSDQAPETDAVRTGEDIGALIQSQNASKEKA